VPAPSLRATVLTHDRGRQDSGAHILAEMIESSLPVPGKRRPYEKRMVVMRKHHQMREGQIVRVIDGPLTGFRGEVKEVDEQTAKVAVQVFGRVTPMDLALGQIELVPENSN
jgi:transcription antitermination factor NusG